MLVVGMAYIGEETDGWPDYRFKMFHLAGLGDPGFKNGQIMLRAHLPHRKGHPDLGIVTLRTADDLVIGVEQLKQPLLHDGFPVAAGYADHRDIELPAMKGPQLLQRSQCIFNKDEGCAG